jgi:hypothetical protein
MKPTITESDVVLAERAILEYGSARDLFCQTADRLRLSGLLFGNDNFVGIAGEYWAKRFYMTQGWHISEIFASNNAGHDFRCEKAGQSVCVSVKIVSDFSKRGKQLPIKASAKWDHLCMILLTNALVPYAIGTAEFEDLEEARRRGKIRSASPVVSRSWLGPKGWLTNFGSIRHIRHPDWPFEDLRAKAQAQLSDYGKAIVG